MNPTEPTIVRSVRALQDWADAERRAGHRIALVPTMGKLHEGHLSLVQIARSNAERTVVSVFVNPTQFGPNEDYARYPRDLEGDVQQLRALSVDVVFAPPVSEMYPSDDATWVEVERLTAGLCGRERPHHFRGVTTIVARLLNAAKPHIAVFGEKDYQQLVVIRRMVRDLHFDVAILGGPTVREPDGLAKSSRNEYLSAEGRKQATALNAALVSAMQLHRSGERDGKRLIGAVKARIRSAPLIDLEYVELRDAETLEEVSVADDPAVLAVAARIEGTRLIDNTKLGTE